MKAISFLFVLYMELSHQRNSWERCGYLGHTGVKFYYFHSHAMPCHVTKNEKEQKMSIAFFCFGFEENLCLEMKMLWSKIIKICCIFLNIFWSIYRVVLKEFHKQTYLYSVEKRNYHCIKINIIEAMKLSAIHLLMHVLSLYQVHKFRSRGVKSSLLAFIQDFE